MPIIELDNITRSYTVAGSELKVLKGVSLSIEDGEFLAIMGPSGSGKSTLLQILGLLDRPTRGTYKLLGRDVSKLSDDEGASLRSQTIGFIFQMFNLLPRTSALRNVMLPMIYAGEENRFERSSALLTEVGLADRMEHKPNELSGGQQQRVAVARAMVNRPRIIFADEPTGNLASDQATEIMAMLENLNKSGITVIMVTHESDIAAYTRRIIRLKDGVIVSDEPTGRKKPKDAKPVEHARIRSIAPAHFFSFTELKEYSLSALRAMATNKARSALSILGILIGVSAVIAMLAIGRGAQKSIESRLSSLGSNLLMLMPGSPSSHGVHMEGGSASRLTIEDIKAIRAADPGIVRVDGNVNGGAQVVYGSKNANTQITGATAAYAEMRASQPYYGRFFTDQEDLRQERVALLGQTVVTKLFGSDNPAGALIKINRVSFRVLGILPLKGAGGFRDQDDIVILPLNTAMNRVLGKKYLNNISIECASPQAMPAVIDAVTQLMRLRHHIPAHKEDDFEIRNLADIQAAVESTTKTFSLLLGTVAAISLLVGGIGIMNIMLVSVSERTREIGLRKAVGASRRAILAQFLLESASLSTLGGILGILLGTLISFTVAKLAGWATAVTPQAVSLAFFFSAGVGIIFGFWPARKASLLSPIEALRYE